jgi:tetratricopeptide (TPR) repeat protein
MEPVNRTGQISNRRLDSWKEIAAFFDRDERTVRRWEKERALPVHRVPGKGRGSVYAFTSELAQWLKSPQFAEEPESGAATASTDASRTPADSDANIAAWDGAERRVLPGAVVAPDSTSPKSTLKKYILAGCFVAAAVLSIIVARSSSFQLSSFLPASLLRRLSDNSKLNSLPPSTEVHGKSVPANPEALELYLKGRYEWSKRSPESLNKAVDFFTQSIVRDPNYAPAYAGLADTYNLLREYTNMPANEAYPRAIAAAKKAVELDDTLSDAHRSLAFATFYWTWDFVSAEKEFKRAIELNPKDPVAHHWYATALGALGRFPEAVTEIDRARELDPTSESIVADKGILLFDARRSQEAVVLLTQIEATDPSFYSPHAYLVSIALYKKDYPRYLAESKKAAELKHDQIGMEIHDAAKRGFETSGESGLLKGMYRVEKQYYERGAYSGVLLAEVCVSLGKKEEALAYLRKSCDTHDPVLLNLKGDIFFDNLHSDPAYRDLLARIGLPPDTN